MIPKMMKTDLSDMIKKKRQCLCFSDWKMGEIDISSPIMTKISINYQKLISILKNNVSKKMQVLSVRNIREI